MAQTISFRGSFVRQAHITNPTKGGRMVTIHFTSDFSDPVKEKMGWGDIDDSISSAKLSGKLQAENLRLKPSDRELAKYGVDLDIKSVYNFEVVAMKDKEGEVLSRELRFQIDTRQRRRPLTR